MLAILLVVWVVLEAVQGVTIELNMDIGQQIIKLDEYVTHDEFFTTLLDLIGDKVAKSTEKLVSCSQTDAGQLLSNIDATEYSVLQILQSLTSADTAFTQQLIEHHSRAKTTQSSGSEWMAANNSTILSEWLRSRLNFPTNGMYLIVKSIATSTSNGLSILPQYIINEVDKMVDFNKMIKIAADRGDIEVIKWILKRRRNLGLSPALETAWHQEHWDILNVLLKHGALMEGINSSTIFTSFNTNGETLLHLAAESDSSESARFIIQNGANVNAQDRKGRTALYRAVKYGDFKTSRLLIEEGADVNLETAVGDVALHAAAEGGDLALVDLLIGSGAKVDKYNKHNLTPLAMCEQYAVKGIARYLLINGIISPSTASPDVILHSWAAAEQTDKETNLTQETVDLIEKNSEIVRTLVWRGGRTAANSKIKSTLLNVTLEHQIVPLAKCLFNLGAKLEPNSYKIKEIFVSAVGDGKYVFVKMLLDEGMPPDTKLKNGNTALHKAAEKGDAQIFHLLANRGSDINATDNEGFSVLHMASKGGNPSIVEYTLNAGASVDVETLSGRTPLSVASFYGEEDTATTLIQRGANLKHKDQRRYTALHDAALGGRARMVVLLLEQGMNANGWMSHWKTPLYIAAEEGNEDVVRALVSGGARLFATDLRGETPLHVAAGRGHVGVVETFLENDMDVDERSLEMKTPLHLAAHYGRLQVVRLLLDRGADINAEDEEGRTPLEEAGSQCIKAIIQLLIEKGGKMTSLIHPECLA